MPKGSTVPVVPDRVGVAFQLKRKALPLATAVLVFALLGSGGLWLQGLDDERVRAERDQQLRDDMGAVHQELHTELASAWVEVRLLADWIAVQEHVSDDAFSEFSARMIERHAALVSTTELPDDVIARTFPHNEALIGLDVGAHPTQGLAVQAMRESGRPVATGPIALAQGGEGLILRAPVFRAGPSAYFGHVSLVFDLRQLVALLEKTAQARSLSLRLLDADHGGMTAGIDLLSGAEPPRAQAAGTYRIPLRVGPERWVVLGTRSGVPRGSSLAEPLVFMTWLVALLGSWGAYWNVSFAASLRRTNRSLRESEKRALAARDAKAAFLATMSHELRTPMNGVIASAELLGETSLDPEQRDHVDTVVGSGRALLHVINDILDFSKLESNKVELAPEPTDVKGLVLSLSGLFSRLARERGVSLETHVDSALPPYLLVDGHRLRQVLTNLLSNAVKFTERGEVCLNLSVVSERAEPQVVVSVKDTGIGMASTTHLFEEFTQEDATTTRRFGGSGLGLSISKKLIDLMGGSIGAESEPGHGSKFWVTFPLIEAVPRPPSLRPSMPIRPGVALIVDDNRVNRRVAGKILERFGWTALSVEDGARAIDELRPTSTQKKVPIDVVFMDCAMPVMDGYETTRRIRCLGGELEHLPVIAMTANSQPEDRARCLAAGMDDFLTKPLALNRVEQALLRWGRAAEESRIETVGGSNAGASAAAVSDAGGAG